MSSIVLYLAVVDFSKFFQCVLPDITTLKFRLLTPQVNFSVKFISNDNSFK